MDDATLLQRLLFLAQEAVRAAIDEHFDDPDDYFICRELAELEPMVSKALKEPSAVLTRWGRPAIKPVPVPVSERFEFSVFNSEYEEQAGGTVPTYAEALSYGQHYLAMYSQDGLHSLELRRVEVLPHHALPVPEVTP